MVDKKAQIKHSKLLGVFLLLVLCVVLVMAVPLIIDAGNPASGSTTENSTVELNFNITEEFLKEIKFHWDGTNYTIYDDDLVLMYNFNNISLLGENGTHVFDISTYENNGTMGGSPIFNFTDRTSGNYDGVLKFDGVNDYIQIEDSSSLNGSDSIKSFSISFWIKFSNSASGTHGRIINKGNVLAGTTGVGYECYVVGSVFECDLNNQTGKSSIKSSFSSLVDDIWYFITWDYNGSETNLYSNGLLMDSDSVDFSSFIDTTHIRIGKRSATNEQYFNGSLDEIRIWNKSLSQTEIQEQYLLNLKKYNVNNWTLYINQSNVTISSGISEEYNYFSCATNNSDNENCTDSRTLIRVPESETIIANFSSMVGNINNNFYGAGAAGSLTEFDSVSNDDDCVRESISNFSRERSDFLNTGMNIIRRDMKLDENSYENGTFNSEINKHISITEWAYNNNIKIIFTADYMPDWLNDTTKNCSSSPKHCPPTNHTRWGELVIDFINNVTLNGLYNNTIIVEVWNEPSVQFFMPELPNDDIEKIPEYNLIYNATYNAIKSSYPNMPVIGPGGGNQLTPNMMHGFLSNFSDKMDGVSIHNYVNNDDAFTGNLNDTNWVAGLCNTYSANCSKIYLDEFNSRANSGFIFTDKHSAVIGDTFVDSLNNYAENMTNMIFIWSIAFKNSSCDAEYNFSMYQQYEPSFTQPYNVTKAFATNHPPGATVYTSSATSSAVKTISSKNGNEFYITVINTDTEARNITVDTDGALTKLFNMETGEEFSSDTGVFAVGVMDSYEILYLGYQGTISGLVCQMNLDENTGTTAHDVSGNSNDGIITGALWFTDGILNTLTAITDYTINPTTGLFTIVNSDYSWSQLFATWDYNLRTDIDNDANSILGNTSTGITGFFESISPVYAILAVLVIILVLVVLVRVVQNKNDGRTPGL